MPSKLVKQYLKDTTYKTPVGPEWMYDFCNKRIHVDYTRFKLFTITVTAKPSIK